MRANRWEECGPEMIMGVGERMIKLQLYVSGNVLIEPLFCKYCNIIHMYYFKMRKTMEGRGGVEASATEETSQDAETSLGSPSESKG